MKKVGISYKSRVCYLHDKIIFISVSVTISDNGATPTLGQSYTLTCSVSGEQSEDDLTYQWLKNGTMRSETVDTITFPSLELSDSGMYTCTVTVNSTMSYNATMNITLQCEYPLVHYNIIRIFNESKANIFHLFNCVLLLVPSPRSVTVTSDPVSPIQPFSSQDVTLTCTVNVELNPAVDVPVTLNTAWTGPDGFMNTNTAQPFMGSTTTYTSSAIVSSFGREKSGKYTCNATITSESQFIFSSSEMGHINVTTGKIY